jgi:hypothetical protein
MISSTVQFITGMKLRELQRQREHFRDSYRRLRQEVGAAPNSVQRLRRLYEGLQELKFAGQPLHPEVVNLEMALRELEAGTLAPDVLSLWQGRLEHELSAGKQKGLSSYWRWILYLYGPQILQKFGTFRFLIPELVPMQLIGEQRLQDSSLDGGNA